MLSTSMLSKDMIWTQNLNQNSPGRGLTVIATSMHAQLLEVQKPHDLYLASDQGHISMHSTYSATSTPNHVTAVTLQSM